MLINEFEKLRGILKLVITRKFLSYDFVARKL